MDPQQAVSNDSQVFQIHAKNHYTTSSGAAAVAAQTIASLREELRAERVARQADVALLWQQIRALQAQMSGSKPDNDSVVKEDGGDI